ncbi:hypothetical protein HWQ46_24800 [Shewanella sp. D64]|uniref:hypothetical protein n=1 Tax=unclassified Shewanella TaxID=196818 RepID=UPI0022BA24D6|nr:MULTISPECIES: hypothetical protein [unclassified Shewanella]MEC4728736.1 hypothetical protein [Shewanella sp. D64]MEC4740605.1 hypothetical protein [Shewanella sp. E94]WBJ95120.1 hypothetical protein HWQ47_25480 [Shewanella sp. MTB7]
MSVIRAVGEQWEKAQFADQLVIFFRQDPKILDLFIGATNIGTVAHVIAALMHDSHRLKAVELDVVQVFLALFDGFLLLFVKEVQGGELNQAEQLVLTLSRHYAEQLNCDEFYPDSEVRIKSERLLFASRQLDDVRRQKRTLGSNMGHH